MVDFETVIDFEESDLEQEGEHPWWVPCDCGDCDDCDEWIFVYNP